MEDYIIVIYYSDEKIMIRDMADYDASVITEEERKQGWNATIDKYRLRLKDQAEGRAISLIAEYCGNAAGYINVYPDSGQGAFAGKGYPEIVDFGVLEKYRRLESIAAEYGDVVYLGVGLHNGYGSAQRMYIKRGYIPDGTGVWYGEKICEPYTECCNDDDLILYLSKRLSGESIK